MICFGKSWDTARHILHCTRPILDFYAAVVVPPSRNRKLVPFRHRNQWSQYLRRVRHAGASPKGWLCWTTLGCEFYTSPSSVWTYFFMEFGRFFPGHCIFVFAVPLQLRRVYTYVKIFYMLRRKAVGEKPLPRTSSSSSTTPSACPHHLQTLTLSLSHFQPYVVRICEDSDGDDIVSHECQILSVPCRSLIDYKRK